LHLSNWSCWTCFRIKALHSTLDSATREGAGQSARKSFAIQEPDLSLKLQAFGIGERSLAAKRIKLSEARQHRRAHAVFLGKSGSP
jgi:hypothetical protein